MNEIKPTTLIVPDEAAAYANCSARAILRALRAGEFKSLRIGARRLVRVAEIDGWLRKQETKGVTRADSAIVKRIGRAK